MSRFMQQDKAASKSKTEKQRTLPSAGKYTSKELKETKKIPTKEGYQ